MYNIEEVKFNGLSAQTFFVGNYSPGGLGALSNFRGFFMDDLIYKNGRIFNLNGLKIGWELNKKNDKRQNRKCLFCGKDFKVKLSRVLMGKGKFCSQKCKQLSQIGSKIGIHKDRTGVYLKCDNCGKLFYRWLKYSKETKRHYCSNKCRYKNMRNIMNDIAGYKHYNWKGGITSKNQCFRKSHEYIDWRNQVFKRDNYTCKKCGKKSGKLRAHHIWEFSKFPELRLEINNGITLCKKCHIKIHNRRIG